MVFHWPDAQRRDELADSMRGMREAMLAVPGCLSVDPPYLAEDGDCLVGISRWESRKAFLDSGITLGAADEIVEGETLGNLARALSEAFPLTTLPWRHGQRPGDPALRPATTARTERGMYGRSRLERLVIPSGPGGS